MAAGQRSSGVGGGSATKNITKTHFSSMKLLNILLNSNNYLHWLLTPIFFLFLFLFSHGRLSFPFSFFLFSLFPHKLITCLAFLSPCNNNKLYSLLQLIK